MSARIATLAMTMLLALTDPSMTKEGPKMHESISPLFDGLQKYAGHCRHIVRDASTNKGRLHFTLQQEKQGAQFEFNVYTVMEMVVVLKRIDHPDFQSIKGERCRSSEIGLDAGSREVRIAAYAICEGRSEGELVDRYTMGDEKPDLKSHWVDAANLYLEDITKIISLCSVTSEK